MARKKKKEDIIDLLVKKADEARKTGRELAKIATEQAQMHGEQFRKETENRLSKSIATAKKFTATTENDLSTLEKLGKLRKIGVITEKEFQAKKKQILARI